MHSECLKRRQLHVICSTRPHSRDILEAIAQTMREVVSGVDFPFVVCPVVRGVQDTICHKIPHHRIPGFQILLHSEDCLTGLVRPVPHLLELRERLLHGPVSMHTRLTGTTLLTAAICEDLVSCKAFELWSG